MSERVPEDLRLEKRAPNDANDAGLLGLHHHLVSRAWREGRALVRAPVA